MKQKSKVKYPMKAKVKNCRLKSKHKRNIQYHNLLKSLRRFYIVTTSTSSATIPSVLLIVHLWQNNMITTEVAKNPIC